MGCRITWTAGLFTKTSALVKATFKGLGGGDPVKFILATAYPSGRKGDFETRVETHDVSGGASSEMMAWAPADSQSMMYLDVEGIEKVKDGTPVVPKSATVQAEAR